MKEYSVPVPDDLIDELKDSFAQGAIYEIHDDGSETVEIKKVAVAQFDGVQVSIRANEHPPPHFHVAYQGNDASFRIDNGQKLNGQGAILKYEKNIWKWWNKNKDRLIQVWNETRPSDCPVGEYREVGA